MKAKLMSYNQSDFQSKAHMKSMVKDIEEQVEKYGSQMKKQDWFHLYSLKSGTSRVNLDLGAIAHIEMRKHLWLVKKY